jgi:hypothetical protein
MAREILTNYDFKNSSRILNLPQALEDSEPVTFGQLKGRETLLRIDASTPGVIYVGNAPIDSLETQEVWTINRSLFNPAGVRTEKNQATGVAWVNRFTVIYS